MATILNKYAWLAETIYEARRITFKEISRKWQENEDLSRGAELPLRTFHKWCDGIFDMFGFMIECDRKNGYTYYIANENEIRRGGMKRWIFETITESNLLMENRQLKNRILLEEKPTNNGNLRLILQAMREGNRLAMTYYSYHRREPNTFEVEPYCIKLFCRRWYLVANSTYYKEVRVYGLDRIVSLEIEADCRFDLPKDFDAKGFFADCFGVIPDKRVPLRGCC